MPRLSRSVPSYRKHRASGQAVVTIAGVDHYLGPHQSEVSIAAYDRLIAEFLANGRRLVTTEPVTVNMLSLAYLGHAEKYYQKNGRPTTELGEFRSVCRTACRMYGDELAANFGPIALKACRQVWIDSGVTRQTINKRQGRLVRVFKWGVAEELVTADVWQSLRAVEAIHVGRTSVPEMKEVPPVSPDRVDAVLPFLSPVVQAMIALQLLTGMRPGEVCRMRPCDVDRSSDVWEFRIEGHKTAHHGRKRVVYLGPESQDILRPYLLRADDSHCFSPSESREWWRTVAAAARVTPDSTGNARGRRGGQKPTGTDRLPGPVFTAGSYGRAIAVACRKAWPAPAEIAGDRSAVLAWDSENRWAPNQLRHTRGTQIRKRYGLDGAQVILGHAKADVTQIYAELDREKAIEISRQIG
jgi:integrase